MLIILFANMQQDEITARWYPFMQEINKLSLPLIQLFGGKKCR